MSKIAVMFSGQGAQKAGMGKSLYENVSASKEIFEKAKSVIQNITEICFEASSEELSKTINAQPAMFCVDMAAYAAFVSIGFKADVAIGFSVGEYPALCASGVLGFEETLNLLHKRAQWMQEESQEKSGGMAAVLGKTSQEVLSLTQQFEKEGMLLPVNYNCPGQTVVAGETQILEKFLLYCKENKVKCAKLNVNGAFHSPQMSGVSEKIAKHISNIPFSKPNFTLYANKTGLPYGEDIKTILAEQTSSPVQFENSIRHMIKNGVDVFVEVGIGGTLAGFVKRISKEVKIFNIEDFDTLEKTAQQLKELV